MRGDLKGFLNNIWTIFVVNLLLGYRVPYLYLKRHRWAPLGFSPTDIHNLFKIDFDLVSDYR